MAPNTMLNRLSVQKAVHDVKNEIQKEVSRRPTIAASIMVGTNGYMLFVLEI